MNLAWKKTLGQFTKVLGIGKTPPPLWEKFPNNPVIFFGVRTIFAYVSIYCEYVYTSSIRCAVHCTAVCLNAPLVSSVYLRICMHASSVNRVHAVRCCALEGCRSVTRAAHGWHSPNCADCALIIVCVCILCFFCIYIESLCWYCADCALIIVWIWMFCLCL